MGETAVQADGDFDAFYSATRRRIVGAIALVTRDAGAAEDAAQEAYARALRDWHHVRILDRPDIWVLKTGTRLAIDAWRKRRRESDLTDAHPHLAHDAIETQWLQWGLTQLSPAQRRAVVLRAAQGWSFAEIAKATGTSEVSVRQHLHRGFEKLRRIFGTEVSL